MEEKDIKVKHAMSELADAQAAAAVDRAQLEELHSMFKAESERSTPLQSEVDEEGIDI